MREDGQRVVERAGASAVEPAENRKAAEKTQHNEPRQVGAKDSSKCVFPASTCAERRGKLDRKACTEKEILSCRVLEKGVCLRSWHWPD